MTNVVSGILEKYFVDGPRQNKNGKTYFIHSVYVEGEKYGAFGSNGTVLANQGDKVEFTWEPNGNYKNFDGKSFRVVERGSGPQTSKGSGSDRNTSIERQNAARHASMIVSSFADAGIYKSP